VVLVKKYIRQTSTTPAARAMVAARHFLFRASTPPHLLMLRRGVLHSANSVSHAGRLVMVIAAAKSTAANAMVMPTDRASPGIPIVEATSLP